MASPKSRFASLLVLLGACVTERTPVPEDVGPPARIVTLGPTFTELAWVLGAGPRLVGRSRWDTKPEMTLATPDLGDAIRPNVERIVGARPDLVILYPAGDNVPAMEALERAGIRTLALRVDRIRDFLHALDTLGLLLGSAGRADSIRAAIVEELDAVRSLPAITPRPRVFVPAWLTPPMTLGTGSFVSELIEIAGGTNAYADRSEPSFTVAFEDVVRRDPDLILASPDGRRRLMETAPWKSLPAVREARFVELDTLTMSQPSTRLGAAARALAARLRAGG